MRNLRNGNSFEHRFGSTEKVERAILDTQPMEYLYSDPSGHHFMNQESYEQITLDDETLGDSMLYLLPNTVIQIDFYDERPVGIELPNTVTLEVVDTEPSMKGATASASYKPAKMETGLTVQRAALHRGGDQDHHRHPREQVPEPGVNPNSDRRRPHLVRGLHLLDHAPRGRSRLRRLKLGDPTAYEGGQVSLNPSRTSGGSPGAWCRAPPLLRAHPTA